MIWRRLWRLARRWCASGVPFSGNARRARRAECPARPAEQALRCAGTGEGMAPSFMKKTMVYLGLLDDEYDEYDDLEDRAPRAFTAAARGAGRPVERESSDEFSGGMNRIRPMIPRESATPSPTRVQPSPVPRPSGVRPVPVETAIGSK